MRVVALIPAYNEASRIISVIEEVKPFVEKIVVVDDGSSDATFEKAQETGVFVLRHFINRGQGAALQTATDFALRVLHADIVVHFDADGQLCAKEIPLLIEPILEQQAEVVLGSRFLGNAHHMPRTRKWAVRAGVYFTMFFSGIKVTDTHNGFRALSASAAEKITITLDRFAHASQILDLIKAQKLSYVERPVTLLYSQETLAKAPSSFRMFTVVKDLFKEIFFGGL